MSIGIGEKVFWEILETRKDKFPAFVRVGFSDTAMQYGYCVDTQIFGERFLTSHAPEEVSWRYNGEPSEETWRDFWNEVFRLAVEIDPLREEDLLEYLSEGIFCFFEVEDTCDMDTIAKKYFGT